MPMHEWIDMSSIWDEARQLADERHSQKRGFASSRYWNPDSHFYGMLGEILIEGLTGAPVDIRLRVNGDKGHDFYGTDVKAATFWNDPHLKHPVRAKFWPDFYILVAIRDTKARYCGWTDVHTLKSATIRDYGYGSQRSMLESELNKESYPPTFDAYTTS
jgi:hypothetical protein